MSWFKNLIFKKMLQSQMKNVPKAEQDRILGMVEANPELFEKIATEVQEAMKNGQDQMSASMSVMRKYQGELQKLATNQK